MRINFLFSAAVGPILCFWSKLFKKLRPFKKNICLRKVKLDHDFKIKTKPNMYAKFVVKNEYSSLAEVPENCYALRINSCFFMSFKKINKKDFNLMCDNVRFIKILNRNNTWENNKIHHFNNKYDMDLENNYFFLNFSSF